VPKELGLNISEMENPPRNGKEMRKRIQDGIGVFIQNFESLLEEAMVR